MAAIGRPLNEEKKWPPGQLSSNVVIKSTVFIQQSDTGYRKWIFQQSYINLYDCERLTL